MTPPTDKFTLPPEQAMVFAERRQPRLPARRFRSRGGRCWRTRRWSSLRSAAARASAGATSRNACSARSARFFRPGYHNNLVAPGCRRWTGVVAKLESGATVADVGCGHGFSTIIMAKAFPKSTFIGYDFHPDFDRRGANARRAARRRREHAVRSGARPATFRPRISTSSRSSIACTTWAIRSARRGMSGSR